MKGESGDKTKQIEKLHAEANEILTIVVASIKKTIKTVNRNS
jgi:hypothetical protein